MTRNRITLLALVTLASAATLGALTHNLWAATPRPFLTPPKIIAGKFKPDPVAINTPTVAHLFGIAIAPEKVDHESLAALTWTWHIDKVQFKATATGAFATAPTTTYEANITSGGSIDSNAFLVLKPKTAGFWKVTLHATATYANVGGEVFTGNSDPKDLFVTAVDNAGNPTSQPVQGMPIQPPH